MGYVSRNNYVVRTHKDENINVYVWKKMEGLEQYFSYIVFLQGKQHFPMYVFRQSVHKSHSTENE